MLHSVSTFWRHFRRRAASGSAGDRRPLQTIAVVEALAPRVFLSADPVLGQRLLGAGFEKIIWKGQETYAEPGQWLASFRNVHGSIEKQFADASAKLGKAAPRAGLRIAHPLGRDGLFRIDAPAGTKFKDVRAALGRVKGLDFAEPNFAVWAQSTPPDDPQYANQYGLNNTGAFGLADADIDAPEAWDLSTGSDVVVGVIDTGVDYNHPDLAASMWVNPFEVAGDGIDNDGNGFVDDIHGADFADLDGDPMDDHNHGTHVAGIIAASANNGQGTAGVAFNARIMALRFLTADGFGGTEYAIQALNYAMDMKSRGVNIRVTNNSWGGAEQSQAMDQAIRRSGDAGMLFIAAAGNGDAENHVGFDIDAPGAGFYPASEAADNLISVAATDSSDLLAGFSNFGAAGVDLGAPGVSVISTIRDGGYTYYSGTSMATPLVSGVAALAFSFKPDATWQQVRDAIFAGVDPLPSLAGKTVTGGRLNANHTLLRLQPTAVVGRHLFYNNSSFDGRSAAANALDDAAVAPDKVALLPGGGQAGFANYTSYYKGITGVMVDVRNLPAGALTADDFSFNVGTNADLLASWQPAPAPSSVSVRRGAGVDGSDRVTLTFPDGAIRNTWLRITVKPDEQTGLASPDVFYFGNVVGEIGNSPLDAAVNSQDLSGVRAHLNNNGQTLSSAYDFDRDGRVSAQDLAILSRARTDPVLSLITLLES